jgi:uncharacterized protein
MPELFPDLSTYLLCSLILLCAQLIYAAVGFGAGMFSIALLALVLPDLAKPVATLLVLFLITEVGVLTRVWRQAKPRLLLGLLPTTALGMWLGTEMLAAGDVAVLKLALGVVVAAAGGWFLFRDRRSAVERVSRVARGRNLITIPFGFVSGVLAGLFGTGGPPVIVLLKGYGLDKGAFRATLISFFLLMSLMRGGTYINAGLLTTEELLAALWLLPASLAGTVLGMVIHGRLSERFFGYAVSLLLILLGGLLVIGR